MHEEHRQRLRAQYIADGIENMSSHNVLELLLFYAIPRKDTNPIAHELMDAFGSLNAVFEAPIEELMKINGIGEYAASLIKLIPQISARFIAEKSSDKIAFSDTERFHKYVMSKFFNQPNELMMLFSLDNAGRLLNATNISLGTKREVSYDNRTILEVAFRNNASNVVIAHNHPSGFAAPSKRDLVFTQEMIQLFRNVGIKMLDHIVVAKSECFSMAAAPKLQIYFI